MLNNPSALTKAKCDIPMASLSLSLSLLLLLYPLSSLLHCVYWFSLALFISEYVLILLVYIVLFCDANFLCLHSFDGRRLSASFWPRLHFAAKKLLRFFDGARKWNEKAFFENRWSVHLMLLKKICPVRELKTTWLFQHWPNLCQFIYVGQTNLSFFSHNVTTILGTNICQGLFLNVVWAYDVTMELVRILHCFTEQRRVGLYSLKRTLMLF